MFTNHNFFLKFDGFWTNEKSAPVALNSELSIQVKGCEVKIEYLCAFGNDIEINAMMNAFILRHVLHSQDRLFQIPKNEYRHVLLNQIGKGILFYICIHMKVWRESKGNERGIQNYLE